MTKLFLSQNDRSINMIQQLKQLYDSSKSSTWWKIKF